jgi:hypothetical protein
MVRVVFTSCRCNRDDGLSSKPPQEATSLSGGSTPLSGLACVLAPSILNLVCPCAARSSLASGQDPTFCPGKNYFLADPRYIPGRRTRVPPSGHHLPDTCSHHFRADFGVGPLFLDPPGEPSFSRPDGKTDPRKNFRFFSTAPSTEIPEIGPTWLQVRQKREPVVWGKVRSSSKQLAHELRFGKVSITDKKREKKRADDSFRRMWHHGMTRSRCDCKT